MTSTESSSQNLYDLIWGVNRISANWSVGRFEKLYDLLGTLDVRGKRVLDVCCGMGSKAYAALELGAQVWAYDGSTEGPNLLKHNVENRSALPEKLKGLKRFRYQIMPPDIKRLTIIPGRDVAAIVDYFGDTKFDIVYMGWALMHVADPEKAANDLQILTKPGGLIALTYYHQNYRSQLTLDIHEYTYGLPLDEAADITAKLGKRWGFERITSLRELLDHTEGNQTLIALKRLITEKNYTVEEVEEALHIEDMATPYLRNLHDDVVAGYFAEQCKILYRRPGLLRVQKKNKRNCRNKKTWLN